MTHEELLEKFTDYEAHFDQVLDEPRIFAMLRAVVERHTYVLTGKKMRGKAGLSKRCTECGFAYPCPTIEDIQKELP